MNGIKLAATAALACMTTGAPPARAQYSIPWHSIDAGGGASIGGNYSLHGTIGQPDAGEAAAGEFVIHGGFMAASVRSCYADCDTATGLGVLDIFDFLCFQDRFTAMDPYACDCDTSSGPGVCDIFDFLCFQDAFTSGCP